MNGRVTKGTERQGKGREYRAVWQGEGSEQEWLWQGEIKARVETGQQGGGDMVVNGRVVGGIEIQGKG